MLGAMKRLRPLQRRTAPRFRLQPPVRMYASALPLVAGPTSDSRVIDGQIQNISCTGLCFVARQRLKISELLVGEIVFPGTRARVPTLLQVRWVRTLGAGYRAGLHFVMQAGIVAALRAPRTAVGQSALGRGSKLWGSF